MQPMYEFGITSFASERTVEIFGGWGFFIALFLVLGVIIFKINETVKDRIPQTVVALLSVAPVFYFSTFYYYEVESIWAKVFIGTISLSLAWFTYILDDLVDELYANRDFRMVWGPVIIGIAFGGTLALSFIMRTWLISSGEVTGVASYTIMEIYEWDDYDCSTTDDEGNRTQKTCYRWEYKTSTEPRIAFDYEHPVFQKSDYSHLVSWSNGRKDDVRTVHYRIYAQGDGQTLSYYLSQNPYLQIPLRTTPHFHLNLMDQIIKYGGNEPKRYTGDHEFSIDDVLKVIPMKGPTGRSFSALGVFFKQLSSEHFQPLRKALFWLYGSLVLIAVFIRRLRQPIGWFVVSSTVIILLIIMGAFSRSNTRSFTSITFGGGGFGGGGAGGRW